MAHCQKCCCLLDHSSFWRICLHTCLYCGNEEDLWLPDVASALSSCTDICSSPVACPVNTVSMTDSIDQSASVHSLCHVRAVATLLSKPSSCNSSICMVMYTCSRKRTCLVSFFGHASNNRYYSSQRTVSRNCLLYCLSVSVKEHVPLVRLTSLKPPCSTSRRSLSIEWPSLNAHAVARTS